MEIKLILILIVVLVLAAVAVKNPTTVTLDLLVHKYTDIPLVFIIIIIRNLIFKEKY